ncbi:IclR family transcriptional regulator, partial [Providencia heimbachae]
MNNRLQSAGFVLSLLNHFSLKKPVWGVRELARHIDKGPSVVQRGFNILEEQGFLQKNKNKEYLLGLRCIEVGHLANNTRQFSQLATDYLRPLVDKTHETLFIYRRYDDIAICNYILESDHFIRFTSTEGEALALHEAPFTQVILGSMDTQYINNYLEKHHLQEDQILKNQLQHYADEGYAYSKEAYLAGTQGLSVPIFSFEKGVLGSLCIAASSQSKDLIEYY